MGELFTELKKERTLVAAWRHVRSCGMKSASPSIRGEVEEFDAKVSSNLRSIQQRIIRGSFVFPQQTGVIKRKSSGGRRPLVLAPVQSRIVQRALLDVLASAPAIKPIIEYPMSVGGIHGVDQAIAIAMRAMHQGKRWYIRSDIKDFFNKIPKTKVLGFIERETEDVPFVRILANAVDVSLLNEAALGEDALIFPTSEMGVAQGSALSPLLGNILLHDFDHEMNCKGIVCIRYIDDFLILSPSKKAACKAFEAARTLLQALGLDAYDPSERPDKANIGEVADGFDFLGCHVVPGLVQPSKRARTKLLDRVREILANGKRDMARARRGNTRFGAGAVQALDRVNRTVKGWGEAFAFCTGRQAFNSLDDVIWKEVETFLTEMRRSCSTAPPHAARRMVGVWSLSDTKQRPLPEISLR